MDEWDHDLSQWGNSRLVSDSHTCRIRCHLVDFIVQRNKDLFIVERGGVEVDWSQMDWERQIRLRDWKHGSQKQAKSWEGVGDWEAERCGKGRETWSFGFQARRGAGGVKLIRRRLLRIKKAGQLWEATGASGHKKYARWRNHEAD